MKKLWFYLLAFAAPAAFAIAPDQVCFYEHGNFTGQSYCVSRGELGSSHANMPEGWHDRISSIQTGDYVNVEVFEHPGFQGLAMVFEGNHGWLNQAENTISSFRILGRDNPGFCIFEHFSFAGKRHCRSHDGTDFTVDLNALGFNDLASSIYVQKNNHNIKVIGHEHSNMTGQQWNHSETSTWFPNDNTLSSLTVTAAAKVCLHEHANFRGQQWCMRHNGQDIYIPNLAGTWNDYISSMAIPPGHKVTAFRDVNYQDKIGEFTSDIPWLGVNNDSISSFIVSSIVKSTTPAAAKYGDKTWANYHWLGAHNAHVNTGEDWWVIANQEKNYENLLNSGVRVLNLDIHDSTSRGNRDVYLCHGSCWGWLGTNYVSSMPTFRVALNRIGAWLRQHPLEVVTITLEDNVDYRALFDAALRNGQVGDLLFNPHTGRTGGQWPKLSKMVQDNKRLIILTSKSSNADAANGIGYDRNYLTENYWSLGFWGNDTGCWARWNGSPLSDTSKAFHMSHFRTSGSVVGAAIDNSYSKLSNRINNECFNASGGRLPNILLLDYVDIGAGKQMVDELNRRN